ncbi:MAG: hypothetical protein ACJ8AT_32160 [Hyalangium sp.]|uniref:hypothetical protein n=1 Tax=Hyalangium sp. TaxID=2028555 RepID=UPI00389B3825
MPTPPTNPGLVKALEGIRGTLTREAALHFYAELNQATLLLAQREGPAQPESGLTKEGALMEYLVVTGPDPPKGSC